MAPLCCSTRSVLLLLHLQLAGHCDCLALWRFFALDRSIDLRCRRPSSVASDPRHQGHALPQILQGVEALPKFPHAPDGCAWDDSHLECAWAESDVHQRAATSSWR